MKRLHNQLKESIREQSQRQSRSRRARVRPITPWDRRDLQLLAKDSHRKEHQLAMLRVTTATGEAVAIYPTRSGSLEAVVDVKEGQVTKKYKNGFKTWEWRQKCSSAIDGLMERERVRFTRSAN
jgi:hypothetical protein